MLHVKSLFKSITKKIGYVFAATILITAGLIIVGRLMTPVLNKHLPDIERWASTLLQTPVSIGKANVSWYKYQPGIRLKSVTILGKDAKDPLLQVDAIRVFFSIPQSLWQHKLVPSGIMISGTSINLNQSSTGDFSVQGFPSLSKVSGQPFQHETKFSDVMGLLSMQSHLILNDIDIRYTGFTGQKRFVTLYNLTFRNNDTAHYIDGQAVLHQQIPTELTLAVRWQGKQYDPAQIKADVYLYASGLSLKQWMEGYSWNNWEVRRGLASAKIWGTWEDGGLKKLQSLLQIYGLELYAQSDKKIHTINRLSGNVGIKHEGADYVIAGEDIFIDLPSRLWPATQFYLSLTRTAEGKLIPKILTLGYLSLDDMQTFLPKSTPWMSETLRKKLTEFHLKGSLENVSIHFSENWQDWRKLSLETQFHQIGFLPAPHLPGVNNLSGQLIWNGNQADLRFNSQRMSLQYDDIFEQPINIDQLLGDAKLQIDQNDGWILNLASIQMINDEMKLKLNGKVTSQSNASPIADIIANFSLQNASHASRYLPIRWFDTSFIQWMKEAFISGEMTEVQVNVKGTLDEFPYDHQNGSFSAEGKVNNFHLHYAPEWPDLQHIYGKLAFVGRKMTLAVDKAQILNIPIEQVHGEILDVGGQSAQILQIRSGKIQTDFSEGLAFLTHSPLKATIGKMFADMKLKGLISLTLGLTVPFATPEKTSVLGDIHFDDAHMQLPSWDLALSHLKGDLHFTEATTEATRITGELFDKPIEFSLHSIQDKKAPAMVRASLKNQLQIADLETWLKIPFSKVLQGGAYVDTDIDLSLTEPMQIHLRSNLVGVTVKLPEQYGKGANESRDFMADIIVAERKPLRIKLDYGKSLNAALVVTQNKDRFNLFSADLHLGNGSAEWPKDHGLYITGHFDQLDWEKIKSYIDQYSSKETSGIVLREIDVEADKIELEGHQFKQVNLHVMPEATAWKIEISSPTITGDIQTPKNFSKQGLISARFQHFNLSSTAENKVSAPTTLHTARWPAISFVAEQVSYNDMSLGQVAFKTVTTKQGLSIQSLHIFSSRLTLQAEGDWSHGIKKNQATHLVGSAYSEHVSDLLSSLGYNASNFISHRGHINFNLGWQGTPFAPSVGSMNGRVSISLGKGRIVDVGESGAKMDIGRMLSIFSLQTIPRRLSLDFSDLFQKGYSFDSVNGDFTFRNGDAYTNNFTFNGPVASVAINGRIGFKEKDYDFTLSVTPHVTSSIPVAATLLTAWNPIVGIAALAANTVITPAISQATTHYYEVKGSWSNPVWKEIKARG